METLQTYYNFIFTLNYSPMANGFFLSLPMIFLFWIIIIIGYSIFCRN